MSERNFTQLKKELSIDDFNSFCLKVMNYTVRYSSMFSQKTISRHFRITKSCFRRIREYSTIAGLISEEMALEIANSCVKNQKTYSAKFGGAAMEYHHKLMRKKEEYIISCFSSEEIKLLAEEFANNRNISKAALAKKHSMTIYVIGRLLQKSIVENIIDDDIFRKIEERSIINSQSPEKTREFFKKLRILRNQNSETAFS